MKISELLTVEELRDVLHYDKETGIFTWEKPTSNAVRNSCVAGFLGKRGDLYIGINKKTVLAKHLAVFYVTGDWPLKVNFKDGNKTNLKYSNLEAIYRKLELVTSHRKKIDIDNVIECMETIWQKDNDFHCLETMLKILISDKNIRWPDLLNSLTLKSIDRLIRTYINLLDVKQFEKLEEFKNLCLKNNAKWLEKYLFMNDLTFETYFQKRIQNING
jgi:hypothetical protein